MSSVIVQNYFHLCGIVIIRRLFFWRIKLLKNWQELEFDSRETCHSAQVSFDTLYFLAVSLPEARGCKNASCNSALVSTC